MRFLNSLVFTSVIFCCNPLFAQIEQLEKKIAALQFEIASGPSDEQRLESNEELISTLKSVFELEGFFEYPFEQLTKISTLKSEDEKFRIFNWNLPLLDGSYRYYLYLVVPQKRGGPDIFEFEDVSSLIEVTETQQLDPANWYGAIYYDIRHTRQKGKDYYTLLGWDGNNSSTTFKVMEILSFYKNRVQLGEPVIQKGDKQVNRRIFQYANDVVMTLKYLPGMQAIIFDELVPVRGGLEGQYQYYGPGLAINSYHEEDGLWKLTENIPMKRPKQLENPDFQVPDGTEMNKKRSNVNPLTGKEKP